jgi:hypothetical protein
MEQFARMAVKGQIVGVDVSGYLAYPMTGGAKLVDTMGSDVMREARMALALGRGNTIKGLWMKALGSRLRPSETPRQAGITNGDIDKLVQTAEYQARVLLARAGVA